MKKNNKHKLSRYVLTCLIGLSTITLILFWIIEVFLFSFYYEYAKTKVARRVSNSVSKYYKAGEFEELIDVLAYDESVCIDIVYRGQTIYTSGSVERGCLTSKHGTIYKYKTEFELSGKTEQVFNVINPVLKNRTLIYAQKIDENTYSYVNTSIEPVESSVKILRGSLLYIAIITFLIAIILSLYLSKRIIRPIIKIKDKASHMAKSEFDQMESEIDSSIREIEELNETLNYAAKELSKLDETRRDLLANVSHDLKTPLTMIKAYAELTRDLDNKDKEKSAHNMEIIIEESDRLNNLVNDILELSKLQSGMKNIEYDTFDLRNLITDIINRYNIYEEKEKFDFEFKYEKELLINADKAKMEQVIYNLVNNAMNYTGEDKKVIIDINEGVNSYRVSIKDTGKGIDKSEIDIIWDKYYKNEKNHKRNKIGTGLGLSIVKEILIAHKFNYGVKSKKGSGTEFYFDIPKENVK